MIHFLLVVFVYFIIFVFQSTPKKQLDYFWKAFVCSRCFFLPWGFITIFHHRLGIMFFIFLVNHHFEPSLVEYFLVFCLVSPLVFTTFFGEYVFFLPKHPFSPRKLQRTGKTWWNLAEAGRRNHYLSPATRDVWHDHWKIERRIPGSEWNHGNAA